MGMRLTGGTESAGGASSVEGERIRLMKLQRPQSAVTFWPTKEALPKPTAQVAVQVTAQVKAVLRAAARAPGKENSVSRG